MSAVPWVAPVPDSGRGSLSCEGVGWISERFATIHDEQRELRPVRGRTCRPPHGRAVPGVLLLMEMALRRSALN